MALPHWPPGTVIVLATQGDGPHAIPVSAAIAADHDTVLLALATGRGSLARLRADPRVALLVLAGGDLAQTVYGHATALDAEPLVDGIVAVRVAVERLVDHGRTTFTIDSGVGWHWTDPDASARDSEVHAALARLAQGLTDAGRT